MSRTNTFLLTSLLGTLWAGAALAQPLDARAVRPAVMLLVDTSGSMERLPDDGSASACDDCLPTCTGDTSQDSLQKNRWAVTVEALTGSFNSYTCQTVDRSTYPATDYDYGYYLPHVDFRANLSQSTDGILDSFVSRVKFGLMTFDGVGTTIGGETLVPLTTWATPAYLGQANGAPGMYSYGRVGRLSFPGCPTDYGVNAGARGPGNHPGALISVGISDNADDVRTVNQRIQSSLLEVRPFGGTPIAAMLDDLEHYVRQDPDIRASSDPFYQCRKRVGILITDGAPDALFRDARFQCDSATAPSSPSQVCAPNSDTSDTTPSCQCPYDTAEQVAQRLIDPTDKLLDQLVVVAYNVHEPAALATLNGIAQNGWPSGQPPAGTSSDYPYLITADGPNQLRERLDDLLDGQQPGVTSRSVPVSVNTGNGELGADSKRFDITAGFQMGRNTDEPWSGLLFRRRVLCDGTTVDDTTPFDASEGDIFHVSLNSQGTGARELFTATPQLIGATNGTLRNGSYVPEPVFTEDQTRFDNSRLSLTYQTANTRRPYGGDFSASEMLTVDDSISVSQGLASDAINQLSFDNTLSAGFFGDADNNGLPGQAADRQRIVDYVRGVTRTEKLADIYHSNPVVLPPLKISNVRANDLATSYTSWQRQLASSGSGAHYGSDGRPGVVFVGTNDGILHAFNLDTWRDASGTARPGGHELWGYVPAALFGKMAAMVAPTHQLMFDGTPEVKDVVLQKRPGFNPLFRTILVSALRGAPSFVALDVTFPESPTFLWQTSFPDLGETVGNPAITQVTVNWRGELQQRAVAILPGGSGEQQASCGTDGHALDESTRARAPTGNARNVRCWKRRGRALYVVDVATGQLLQEFGTAHFPSPLTGSVVVDSASIGTSSAAYFFDQDGVLWRLSMLSTEPNDWRATPIYDMFSTPVLRNVSSPQVPLRDWQAGRSPQYAPTLGRDQSGNLVIIAGTGDLDNPMDTANQRVVSLTERRANEGGEIGGEITLNWQLDLEPNESVTGPITLFENNIYFGSFVSLSGSNECALGESRIYGAHAFQPEDPEAPAPRLPKPNLVPLGGSSASPRVLRDIVDPTGSNLLLGLTVARQPICRSPTSVFNAVTQQSVPTGPSGGGLFELKGLMAGSSTGGVNRGGSPIKELAPIALPFTRPSSVSAWFGAVE